MGISQWFEDFCSNLRMSDSTVSTIQTRYHQITKRINLDYYGSTSEDLHSLYVGSYGRGTEIYSSDIDMLVQLPFSTYQKFNSYQSNGQSALLQEVKNCLAQTYSTSKLKGDGQIISIPFYDGINFEVLPAFLNDDGTSFTFADSNDSGSWKTTNPRAEIDAINTLNNVCNKNLKRLCRMARAWKSENNVPISGILLDIFAYKFMRDWAYRDKSYTYYDWMSRDFFEYVKNIDRNQNRWQVMGSNRYIYCFDSFQPKATTAYNLSLEAIQADSDHHEYTAKSKWGEIYGSKFPA